MPIAVSVVVPVYNTSKYLKQCVDSLLDQTLKDVEFIFVDDGSTDDSVEILKQYQAKDTRIKILQQENQYAGVARNNGMKQSTGKYIIFVDSDDFFEPNMLRDAYNCAEKNQAEIVIFGYRCFDDALQKYTPQKLMRGRRFPRGVFSSNDLGEHLFSLCDAAPWNKLFLRDFIEAHHLRFKALKKCNDTYFVQMALALTERITHINKKYVNYRTNNQDSLQGSRNSDRKAFAECGMSVKKGLTEAGKYNGTIRQSAVQYMHTLIDLGVCPPYTQKSLEEFFVFAKEHLIPDLFDSPADFEDCFTANCIYESADFSDFLLRQLQAEKLDKERNYILKSSWEARVGRILLAIPKKILNR